MLSVIIFSKCSYSTMVIKPIEPPEICRFQSSRTRNRDLQFL